MTVYKTAEKLPEKMQYCFVRLSDSWIFCMYQEEDKWTFFTNPERFNITTIDEWQPAMIQLQNPSVDIFNKKCTYDLADVKNDEQVSMMDAFISSVGDTNGNSSRTDSSAQSGGVDVPAEVPVLRATSVESVK